MGQERRKYKRLPIELVLSVNKVFKQDQEIIDHLDARIQVVDISKTGIGFYCGAVLPVGYYFDGKIKLGEHAYFYAVIKIVRAVEGEENEKNYFYGCEFVGLAPFLADKIDAYEETIRQEDC